MAGCKPSASLAPGHANGERTGNWTFAAMAPAGALRSTSRDMAKFLSAYLQLTETPLKAAMVESIKPVRATTEFAGQVALNWFIIGEGAGAVVWHNGMTGGYASFIGFCPSTRQGVAILTNHSLSPDALGFQLLGASPPKPIVTTVKSAADYVGRYPLVQGFWLDVTEAGGALFVQATGQPRLMMRELAPDRFTIIGVPAELSFERNSEAR
jgi:CubicO group peptidase (beta-lactamase class C family)